MTDNLEHITISFCEPNGDGINSYDLNNTVSIAIPNVGDKVNVDGSYREVTEKAFQYGKSSIVVLIYLKPI